MRLSKLAMENGLLWDILVEHALKVVPEDISFFETI
jgi:hypothetical protein